MSIHNLKRLIRTMRKGEVTVLLAKSNVGKSYYNSYSTCPYLNSLTSKELNTFFRSNGE